MLSLFKSRNLTLYFTGKIFSTVGQQVLSFVGILFILDTIGTGTLAGSFASVMVLMQIIFYPLSASLVKGWKKIRTMVSSDVISGITILSIGLLIFLSQNSSGVLGDKYMKAGLITICSVVTTISLTFFASASSSAIPYLTTEKQYSKAIGLSGAISNLSSIIGVLISSIIYTFSGIEATLFIISAMFLSSAILEMFIKLDDDPIEKLENKNIIKIYSKFGKGVWGAFRNKDISRGLSTLLLTGMIITSYHTVLIPYVFKNVLDFVSNAQENFFLTGVKIAGAIGGICGALFFGSYIVKKFSKKAAEISLFYELPILTVITAVVLLYNFDVLSPIASGIMIISLMGIRAVFGNGRHIVGQTGLSYSVQKKDAALYLIKYRFLYSLTEIPLFFIAGLMLDYLDLSVVFLIFLGMNVLTKSTAFIISRKISDNPKW